MADDDEGYDDDELSRADQDQAQDEHRDLVAAAAAFFKWRQSALKVWVHLAWGSCQVPGSVTSTATWCVSNLGPCVRTGNLQEAA